jgi:integrase
MLTAKQIEKAINEGKDVILADDHEDFRRGKGKLVFRLRGKSAALLFQYHWDGKRKLLKVGEFGAMSLTDARAKAREYSAQVQNGLDPQAELERQEREKAEQERKHRALGTVESLFEDYISYMKDMGKSSWPEVQRALLTGKYPAADSLGRETKARDVTKRDIMDLLSETLQRGSASMAGHLRAYLSAAFNLLHKVEGDWTVKAKPRYEYGIEYNPVEGTVKGDTSTGKRALSVEELGQVWNELPTKTSFLTGNCFRLIIAVGGARPKEVLHSTWAEFDLDAKVWHLPGERTKNSRDHDLPLSERALEVLRKLKAKSYSQHLFPSANDASKPMPIASLGKAATRYCTGDEDGERRMDHWSPRDLRRTTRTLLGDAGVSGHIMDCFLNHGLTASVGGKHYDRSQHLREKLQALAAWDKILDKALGVAEGGKIINLNR